MYQLEIWLLAISLAIDCFTVSVASGAFLRRVHWNTFLTMAFFFGLFQALMPFIGWLGASRFHHLIEDFDHWIAFSLLCFLGVRMIREGMCPDQDEEHPHFDPTRLRTILSLAVATSIDALAVGISFAFAGHTTLASLAFPLTAIGIASFVLSVVGCLIGVYFGKHTRFKMEYFGGAVLIGIGVKIVLEHLGLLT